MTSQSSVLDDLIKAAYRGTVFGQHESFAQDSISKIDTIHEQIKDIGAIFNVELYTAIKKAMPDLSDENVQRIMKEIGPKAVGFCPALTAGELTGEENVRRLAAAASAIGVMYFADQTMDRGDELMVSAIERLNGASNDVTGGEVNEIATRRSALDHIKSNIDALALPEDAPIVLDCYNQQVLHNEVLLHKLSVQYSQLDKSQQQDFLAQNAKQIVDLMVVDAGFPSVTTALYAIYRQNDTALLPLAEVHGDESISRLIQICNAVVRIADEAGDWEVDAGHHPEWGIFVINPFNQYHPDIIARFCELASIEDEEVKSSLQQAFKEFHTDKETTRKNASYITRIFFDHVRDYVNALPDDVRKKHSRYILLCKRVLEIGHVNMMGDIALSDTN